VLKVGQSVSDTTELLGDQVLGLASGVGGPPGREVVEHLGLPPLDRSGQSHDFGGASVLGEGVEDGQLVTGGPERSRRVHGAQLLFDRQGASDFVIGIPPAQPGLEPDPLAVAQPFVAPGQQAPDPEQRVVAPSPVAERLSLDPPTDVVDAGVGELHRVEDVDRDDGLGQALGERLEVAGVGIDGGDRDVVPEPPGAGGQPLGHRCCAAVLHHVEQAVAVEIDQLGGEDAVVGGPGGEHLVLVDAQGPDPVKAPGVLCERLSVALDRRPGTVPTDPEAPGDLGHAAAVLANEAADLLGRPSAERPLDEFARFGEGALRTVLVLTAPPALAPHEPDRSVAHRQVADLDHRASVAGAPDPAARTAGQVFVGLDEQPELTLFVGLGQHDEPAHPQQRGAFASTFDHAPCSSVLVGCSNRKNRGPRGLSGGSMTRSPVGSLPTS